MHQRLNFYLIFILALSCKEINKTEEENQLPNQIVLIFDHPPINHKYTFESGMYVVNSEKYEISFIDDQGQIQKYALAYDQEDTIIIKSSRCQVEVGHAYKAVDMLYYLFQNGDSVLFTYDGQKPNATILNRTVPDIEVNYDMKRKEFLDHDEFSDRIKFNAPFFFSGLDIHSKNFGNDAEDYQRNILKEAEEKLAIEKSFLDSLIASGQVASKMKKYKIFRSLFDLKLMSLSLALGIHAKEPMKRDLVMADFFFETDIKFEGQSIDLLASDSAYYVHAYQQMLDFLFYKYYSRKSDRITSTLVENGIAQAGSSMPDYKQVYDSITASQLIDGKAKKYLLTKSIESIMDQHPIDTRIEYFEKFKSTTLDTALIDYLISKYQMDERDDYNIKLVSVEGDTVTYDSLMKVYKGKVIFLDFWASWCGPCIKEMPASKELQKKYENTDISFVYISSDKDASKWENTSIEHGLTTNSYRIINSYSSRQWEEMHIDYIPTYMIFDKNGSISNNYAPRPSDKKLLNLLDVELSN